MMENNSIDEILERLPAHIRSPLQQCRNLYKDKATEIVLRSDRPVTVYCGKDYYGVLNSGVMSDSTDNADSVISSHSDIESTILRLCDYSVYAYQQEINNGFVTIGSGVRVGLSGRAVVQNGRITNIRDVTTLSFRIARDVLGCSEGLIDKVDPLKGVLICGEPGSGKTTLIRDYARHLGYIHRVSVLDERGELTAYNRGDFGFDTGLCDIFVGYPKAQAAYSAIRSMSPELIVCDELGDEKDFRMLQDALRCGVAFIASVHASSLGDLESRRTTADYVRSGAFGSIVFLSGKGQVGRIREIIEIGENND